MQKVYIWHIAIYHGQPCKKITRATPPTYEDYPTGGFYQEELRFENKPHNLLGPAIQYRNVDMIWYSQVSALRPKEYYIPPQWWIFGKRYKTEQEFLQHRAMMKKIVLRLQLKRKILLSLRRHKSLIEQYFHPKGKGGIRDRKALSTFCDTIP